MKKFPLFILIAASFLIAGESNQTRPSQEHNASLSEQNLTLKHIKEQQEREKKYAKEKAFYEGKDYNLSDKKISPKEIESVPTIPPEDDFDMSDVYN
ncbi:hypothetical protein [Nitratifractor salsuginis]|uniref:Uncharacterized protein n=1 Tax=Nitratifractor salsuginis (strain DSM 16511 / JCM 12458 / E9I37-1) TaxID=749222 RepID=E6WZQ2_NITSE|nr:hypothetical protein [Nitratifractor salsuginis]ADV46693.1 hypothetical protein Nitsa_1444 [Nitratifractor salsuginis DSM 16511]